MIIKILLFPLQLLDEERFHSIEKIKTINGHIYMAACGLAPKDEVELRFLIKFKN